MKYSDLSKEELCALRGSLQKQYEEYCRRGLSLDLSRGKPDGAQLDMIQPLLGEMKKEDCFSEAGFDCRNYGIGDGLPELKELFSELFDIPAKNIMIGGNSSLQLMHDTLCRAMLFGFPDSPRPWCREEKIKWLCVCPGYDRHFRIAETLGFELLTVPMTPAGPAMDVVEELVKDPAVKGIFCIPKYSNPTGNTYTKETVHRLVSMPCAAPDFRIVWDNAYAVHDIYGEGDELENVFTAAKAYGTEDRILYFASTSKITLPGAGVAMMAVSDANFARLRPLMDTQIICYDKINQLRHVKYLQNAAHVKEHMKMLGAHNRVKFDIALNALASLEGLGVAEWTKPNGGYFISLDVLPGCAKRVYELMKQAGVTLTKVGATYPYGVDPADRNLRLAPTYCTEDDLRLSMEILCVAVRLAAAEKLSA